MNDNTTLTLVYVNEPVNGANVTVPLPAGVTVAKVILMSDQTNVNPHDGSPRAHELMISNRFGISLNEFPVFVPKKLPVAALK